MEKLRKATGHILKLTPIWDIREHSGGMLPELPMNSHGPFLEGLIPPPGLEEAGSIKVEQHHTLTLQSSRWKNRVDLDKIKC